MLLVLLEGCDIHLIPLALACLEASTCSPIKWYCICTWVGITHTDVSNQVLLCSHADINPLALNRSKDITLDTYCHFLLRTNSQCLLHSTLHWACKRSLHEQFRCCAIVVDHMEIVRIVASCDKVLTQYFVYMLASSKVEFLIELQHRSIANKAVIFTRRWRQYYYFLNSKCQRLVGGELEEYIILFQHIKEYTTELILLFSASSDHPVFLYHRTCRTVKTHIKRNLRRCCTLIGNNKLKLLIIATLYLVKIQHKPLLASFHCLAVPVEIHSILTSIVHDILGLVCLSSQFDLFIRLQFYIHLIQTQRHQFPQCPILASSWNSTKAPNLITLASNFVARVFRRLFSHYLSIYAQRHIGEFCS